MSLSGIFIVGLAFLSLSSSGFRPTQTARVSYRTSPLDVSLSLAAAASNQDSLELNPIWAGLPAKYPVKKANLLADKWEIEKNQPMRLMTKNFLEFAQSKHVVIVEGFANEVSGDSSGSPSLETFTNDLEMSASVYRPSSKNAISENLHYLYLEIMDTYARVRKPIILVGYSKGGVEALHAALRYPELLLEGVVEEIVLFQSPVKGTPLVVEKESRLNWVIGGTKLFFKAGLESMLPEQTEDSLSDSLLEFENRLDDKFGSQGPAELEAKRAEISDKIYYVRAYQDKHQLDLKLKFLLRILGSNLDHHGPNDGVVLTEDQMTDKIGRDAGIIKADHLQLNSKFDKKSTQFKNAKAFFRSTLKHVHDMRFEENTH